MATDAAGKAWFDQARFGMFIHWGVYAVPGRGEWVMHQERIPPAEYAALARRFNPRHYDPQAWAALAREAGMKYMVLTTRHHDGYSLFDSRVSDFTAPKTAAGRDLVAAYAEACRAAGLKVGFYYSLGDWRWPVMAERVDANPRGWQALREYVHAQVRELCTDYGRIDLLWYDGGFCAEPDGAEGLARAYGSRELNAMVRQLQPHILINNRSGLDEDFDTPEQHVRASPPGRRWEACVTLNGHWGYFRDDNLWKPARKIILHWLTATACGGGNCLLNVGPTAAGTIPGPSVRRLRRIGEWLRVHGEAIYGAGPGPLPGATFGVVTAKGNTVYLVVHWWPGRTLVVPDARIGIASARILSTGDAVKFRFDGDRLVLYGLPAKAPDPLCSVIALEREA
jgi:alpha-L-fucosidase